MRLVQARELPPARFVVMVVRGSAAPRRRASSMREMKEVEDRCEVDVVELLLA